METPLFGNRAKLKEKLGGKSMFGRDDCPFCHDIETGERVIWSNKDWAILWNLYPYMIDAKHVMLVPRQHTRFSHEVREQEWSSIGEAYAFLEEFYGEDEYFSFTRESFSERSVEHLHTHFMSGDLTRKALEEMLEKQGYTRNI